MTPNGWKVEQLGNLVTIKSGESPSGFDLLKEGAYPFIKVDDLNNCSKYQYLSRYYTDDIKTPIGVGSVIFPKRGGAILTNKIRLASRPLYMDSNLMAISPREKLINSEFLYYVILNEQLYKLADTSTIPQINNKHINPYAICLPPLWEQELIGSILSTWDKQIQATERFVQLKNRFRQGLRQQLLTGKKRFQEFARQEWQRMAVGDFTIPTPRIRDKPEKQFTALGIRSHGKGTFLKPNFDPAKIEMEKLFEVKKSDLVVNITFAWEGAIAIARSTDDGALVSHRFPTYEFNTQLAIPDFFRHIIVQKWFVEKLGLVSPGGAGRNRVLNKKDFAKIEILMPSVEEQHRIADVLNACDKEIKVLQKKIEALKRQKRGLMQKLLTGQLRVKS